MRRRVGMWSGGKGSFIDFLLGMVRDVLASELRAFAAGR
jgi:hypothetical protein